MLLVVQNDGYYWKTAENSLNTEKVDIPHNKSHIDSIIATFATIISCLVNF